MLLYKQDGQWQQERTGQKGNIEECGVKKKAGLSKCGQKTNQKINTSSMETGKESEET